MMHALLEADDLVRALETFEDRYHAVDVFADDLSEAARQAADAQDTIEHGGRPYRFRVFPQQGVVRLERVVPSAAASGAVAGGLIGGAVAAASKEKGEGVLGGVLLGLLVGGLLGAAVEAPGPPVRRVFAMQLDPRTRQWMAYEGSLLRWMKDRLLVPEGSAA